MNSEEELASARRRVDLFRNRYAGNDDSYYPIRLAIEWQKIFESSPPNIDRARELVAIAKEKKHELDIAGFTFCNHMESTLRQMVRDSLIQ